MIMDILKIQNPNDLAFLRKTCENVTLFGEHMVAFSLNMIDTMLAPNANGHPQGVGLAAPQVGVATNMFVMLATPETNHEATTIINPSIIEFTNDTQLDLEGCLSIPGILGRVSRFTDVKFTYFDALGQQHEMVLSGFPARVFQHEYDHLLGKLFIDRTADLYSPRKK